MVELVVVTIGDSVLWGQGLADESKFHRLAAEDIASALNYDFDHRTSMHHYAHSGAVIELDDDPPCQGVRPVDSSTGLWAEVPRSEPDHRTTLETIRAAMDAQDRDGRAVREQVRLVILNGGANDINGSRILLGSIPEIITPLLCSGLSDSQLASAIEDRCYRRLKALIADPDSGVRATFPNAVIVVPSYFPIVSEESEQTVLHLILYALVGFAVGAPSLLLAAATAGVAGPAIAAQQLAATVAATMASASIRPDEVARRRAIFFYERSLSAMRRAVMELQQDPAVGKPDILLAAPNFGPRNGISAPDHWVFGPTGLTRLQETQFVADPLNNLDQVMPLGPRGDERAQACILAYPAEPMAREICNAAPMFHPNEAGAAAYADAIRDVVVKHHELRLDRAALQRLLHRDRDLSLREALGRYGFIRNGEVSLRFAMRQFQVDCLEVDVWTGSTLHINPAYLKADNLAWRLNSAMSINEGPFDRGELQNLLSAATIDRIPDGEVFYPNSHRRFVVVPTYRSGSRLNLWEIEGLSLAMRRHEGLPPLVLSDWSIRRIRIRANGHTLVDRRLNTTLHLAPLQDETELRLADFLERSQVIVPQRVDAATAEIWIGSFDDPPSSATLQYRPDQIGLGWSDLSLGTWASMDSTANAGHYQRITVDTTPGTRYLVRLVGQGGVLAEADFETLPESLPESDERPFTVFLGSCFAVSRDPAMRVGRAYDSLCGSGENRPHVKFLCGDQVYLDAPWNDPGFWDNVPSDTLERRFVDKYRQTWSQGGLGSGFSALLQRGANFLLSDDHEFWNNYPNGFPAIPELNTRQGREKWRNIAVPLYQAVQSGWSSHSFSIGPLSFFLADTRVNRDAQRENFMARSDFDALTQWIGSLSGPGILVLGQPLIAEATPWSRSVDHVLPDYRQYGRLIRALFEARHDVVLLTGDVHFSRIASCRLHADARLIEVISSPLALVDPGAGSLPVTSPSDFPVAPLPQGITPVGVDYHRVGRPRDVSLAPASGRCAENCMTIAFGLAAANASTVRMRVRAWLLDRPHDEDTGLPIRDYEWETELR